MSECRYPTCSNSVGLQDRDDYRDSRFCCIEHDVLHEKRKMEAKHAQQAVEAEHDTEGYF